MPRIPLPHELAHIPFRVATARALEVGLGRLRGSDLDRPFHGIRTFTEVSAALAYAPLLRPNDRFSHTTAADLWPLPLPHHASELTVHVTASPPANRPRGLGVTGHRSSAGSTVRRHGLPVSAPADLFIELGSLLGEEDLVAVGDALILEPEVLDPSDLRPWIRLDDLRAACEVSRAPGSRRARRAMARLRQGAESRPETLLRLILLAAGLPEPELQVKLFDSRGFIGRFDMVYREARVIVEYDGDQHRTSTRQYERDMTRLDRAAADKWTVVRVRAPGIFYQRARTVERVKAALGG